MGGYNKHTKDRSDYEDYYTHNDKVNNISSHLYIAYKEGESATKKEELINCETENEIETIRLLKKWALIKSERIADNSLLENQFNELATKWKDETGLFSTTFHKIVNDYYFEIVAMGKEIVPFILNDLKNNGPSHWHTALKA